MGSQRPRSPLLGLTEDRWCKMKLHVVLVCLAFFLVLPESSHQAEKALNRYTKSRSGCPCWWDLTIGKVCACCTKEGIQCGFPKHKSCQNKKNKKGCPGIPRARFTLSARGYSCYWKNKRTRDCAWCAFGGYQCGKGEKGRLNHCYNGKNTNVCDSVIGDCRHIPTACDPNADCVVWKPFAKTKLYRCKCKKGYTGNGVTCFDKDGNISQNPDEKVNVKIDLTSDFYVHPHVDGEYNDSTSIKNLKKKMKKVENKPACNGPDCSVTYNL